MPVIRLVLITGMRCTFKNQPLYTLDGIQQDVTVGNGGYLVITSPDNKNGQIDLREPVFIFFNPDSPDQNQSPPLNRAARRATTSQAER